MLVHRISAALAVGGALLLSGCSDNSEQISAALPAHAIVNEEMVLIPAGDFIMGSDKADEKNSQQEFCSIDPLYLNEHPLHKAYLDAYLID